MLVSEICLVKKVFPEVDVFHPAVFWHYFVCFCFFSGAFSCETWKKTKEEEATRRKPSGSSSLETRISEMAAVVMASEQVYTSPSYANADADRTTMFDGWEGRREKEMVKGLTESGDESRKHRGAFLEKGGHEP